MRLGKAEELMLRGYYGESCKKAIKLILTIADSYGCGTTIKIRSAHVSGVSYKNIGDPGIEFLKDMSREGCKVRVKTTMNPCGFDLDKPWLFDVDEPFFKKQMEIIELLKSMGVEPTLSCTPYYADNKPRKGDHVAWAESSAVVYVNSVIGAYTNRESGPSALAAAITGRTAMTKEHKEDRGPEVKVEAPLAVRDCADWGILGYLIGLKVPSQVPLLLLRKGYTRESLKYLAAGLGTSSSTSMFLLDEVGWSSRKLEEVQIDQPEIADIYDRWALTRTPSLVFIGCPHCSLGELRAIAERLRGRKVKKDVRLLISTSRSVYAEAARRGLVAAIERAGAHLVKDTCLVVSPIKLSKDDVVLTDSAKAAHYAETMTSSNISIGKRWRCIEEALGS
ncbi:MAG: aconitase X catalytic domain-containing protein [Desulfurococcaceae archaeon]